MEAEIEIKVREALGRLQWRLKSRPRHRLAIDLAFVMRGFRPFVMVDYLPQTANLLQLLNSVVRHVWKDSSSRWRIMHLDECIYVLHEENLNQYMDVSLSSESWLKFLILDDGPPRMATENESELVKETLRIIQRRVSGIFSNNHSSQEAIDLLCCLSDLEISVPTFNGWLLGYPVIYVFAKEKVSQATRCLSSGDLYLYQLRIVGNKQGRSLSSSEDILSFTVPPLDKTEISDSWKHSFMSYMTSRAECCSIDSQSLRLDVSCKSLQSVAF